MKLLKKCKAELNVVVIRSDNELSEEFKKYATGKGFINRDYDKELAKFKKNNKSCCVKKVMNCYFHQWGTDTIEYDTGFVQYSVAIVEVVSGEFAGKVEMCAPDKITFVDKF